MDKITLQELSVYLPYDLQVQYTFNDVVICYAPMVASLIGNNLTKEIPMSLILDDNSPCKICLRSLSQLTQEIEHKGERFVPIEEIAKIECPNITGAVDKIHSITSFKRGLSFNSSQMGVTYRYEGVTVEITHFKDDIFHKRVINGDDSWVFSYFHNYPAIIQKLHEWHFDTANLLGRGLAVEIKEVTNE